MHCWAATLLLGLSVHAHPIKNLVVLMEENRSFDHLLGWYKSVNPAVDGLDGTEFNYLDPKNTTSQKVFCTPNATYVAPFDPGHSVVATTEEIWGDTQVRNDTAPMIGFVYHHRHETRPGAVMEGFAPSAVSALSALAQEGAVFDRWFAAVPGPTQVNRLYAHSATSNGMATNNNTRLIDGMPQRSIYEALDEAGVDWRVYYELASEVLEFTYMRKPKNLDRMRPFEEFLHDAANGKLKPYTFIDPRFYPIGDLPANDQHPTHDVSAGDRLFKQIYEALRASPQWNQTALLITYDEHGGFFDHVPTPLNIPNPDGLVSTDPAFDFTRSGVRIPAVVVSPWVDRNTVVHAPAKRPFPDSEYELSSIPATVKALFGLPAFLTKRDAWAGSFDDIFLQRTEPRTDMPTHLPDLPAPAPGVAAAELALPCNDLQHELARIVGALNDPDVAAGRKQLEFGSQAEAGDYIKSQLKAFHAKQGVPWRFRD